MVPGELTGEEANAFAERLDAFGEELPPGEQAFLKAILLDAETAPDDSSRSSDDADRTFGEIVLTIHRAYLSPPISLNPQPIPPTIHRFTSTWSESE